MSRVVVLRENGAVRKSMVVDARVKEGREVEVKLLHLASSNDGWTSELGDEKLGIEVYSREAQRDQSPTTSPIDANNAKHTTSNSLAGPKSYKIWKCRAEVMGSLEEVYRLMVETSIMPLWNHDVTSYNVLEKLDEETDIVQCISAASGMVSPRDFLMIRRQTHPDKNTFVIADTGAPNHHPKATLFPDGSVIRGWNGPGGIVIRRLPPSPCLASRCSVCWILNKDLRGWIPRTIVDQKLSGVLIDYIQNLRSATANFKNIFPNNNKPKLK